MADKTLRELARSYSTGELHELTYRKKRAELINGILHGETPLRENDYSPIILPKLSEKVDITERKQERKPQDPRQETTPAKKTWPLPLSWIVSGGCALALVILLIFIFAEEADDTSGAAVTVVEQATPSLIPEESTPTLPQSATAPVDEIGIEDARMIVQVPPSPPVQTTADEAREIASAATAEGESAPGAAPELIDEGGSEEVIAEAVPSSVTDQAAETQGVSESIIDEGTGTDISEATESTSKVEAKESETAAIAAETAVPKEEKATPTSAAGATADSTRQDTGSACKISLLKSRRPYCRDKIAGLGDGPTMVAIPAGRFLMGGTGVTEQPVHEVNIGKAFAMSVHEVTYGEYLQFCENAKRKCPDQPWTGKDYPVVNVSWSDAIAYTNWLSEKTGQTYRLPSEAEWEYAARGGTTTTYPFGEEIDISFAVFSYQNKLNSPLPKTDRSINRNPFRLYHIIGNVREWVADYWNGSYTGAPTDARAITEGDSGNRVVRGGSYNDSAAELRSGARMYLPIDSADSYTGFRVIQEM